MQIPWWAKIAAKLVLARLPFGYAVWQRLGLFRHGRMDTAEYALEVFRTHTQKAGFAGALDGKVLLELGPGDSIATAIIAAAHGARALLVDSGRFVRRDMAPLVELERVLRDGGLNPPSLAGCRAIEEVLDRCSARYMTGGLESLRQVESGSVDLVFSNAVLEHVRRHEFAETMRELNRLLKPNGVCSHQVDLSDHLGGALNNLRFSGKVWESRIFATSGFYTNRIGYPQMLASFQQAGFDVTTTQLERWPALPTSKRHMAPEFRALEDESLCIRGFHALLRVAR